MTFVSGTIIADTPQRRLLQVVRETLSLSIKTSVEPSVAKMMNASLNSFDVKKATDSGWRVTSAVRVIGLRVTCFECFSVLATLAHARKPRYINLQSSQSLLFALPRRQLIRNCRNTARDIICSCFFYRHTSTTRVLNKTVFPLFLSSSAQIHLHFVF